MKQDLIFFGSEGLTSTSANHVADMAKHYQQSTREHLESINFVEESVQVVGSDKAMRTQNAWTPEELASIKDELLKVAQADLLDAYLREAVKARARLTNEVRNMTLEMWAMGQHIELPTIPNRKTYLTEDDYLANLNIKERLEFLQTKQYAAIFGDYVHPHGEFAVARKLAQTKRNHPSHVEKNGRDTLLTTWNVAFTDAEIDAPFYELEEVWREYQARYNGLKHKMELALIADQTQKDEEYNKAYMLYSQRIKELTNDFELWKKAEQQRIADLKIVIPNDLKDTYTFINSLGKKSK